MSAPAPELAAFLQRNGLAAPDEEGSWLPLTGGVSSDIWKVETSRGRCCVKRALARLRVAAEWFAPVERNAFEWAYMEVAERIAPGSVPRPIAHDPDGGVLAMAWLAPEDHLSWKAELLDGRVEPATAAAVGDLVGRIHSATAADARIAPRFHTDASFHALRIDAYLLATARAHPDLAPTIHAVADRTAGTKRALVHGDVSPKNILVGPAGPVLLDAEVAWFGDPAFDLAFCLNHIAIKTRVVAGSRDGLAASCDRLAAAYLEHVDWEERAALEARAASLLPILALARVDGKSPLEYLGSDERNALREAARAAVIAGCDTLADARERLTRD